MKHIDGTKLIAVQENELGQYLFMILMGHLGRVYFYTRCVEARPGDEWYQVHIQHCLANPQAQLDRAKKTAIKVLLNLNSVNRGVCTHYFSKNAETGAFEFTEEILAELFQLVNDEDISLGIHWYRKAKEWAQEKLTDE